MRDIGGKNIAQFHSRNSRDLRANVGMRRRYNPRHINHATKPEIFRPKTSATALLCPTDESSFHSWDGQIRIEHEAPAAFCGGNIIQKIIGLRVYCAEGNPGAAQS